MNIDAIKQELDLNIIEEVANIKGGNSTVIKVKLSDGSFIALKLYKGESSRIKRMLQRELGAISFLNSQNFLNIPEILEARIDLGLIAYRWIEGTHPQSDSKSMEKIISMCLDLNKLNMSGAHFPDAIDAAYSLHEIENQIEDRIIGLMRNYPLYLTISFRSMVELKLNQYREIFKKNQLFLRHTFSISDLGTHNMLFANNMYTFIDFEFFGKDSIEKMVGDFLLHPRNEFNKAEVFKFIDEISKNLKWDYKILTSLLPLLSLKWAVIVFERLLKETIASNTSITHSVLPSNSIEIKYLEYFDFLVNNMISSNTSSILTFHQFTDMI